MKFRVQISIGAVVGAALIGACVWLGIAARKPMRVIDWDDSTVQSGERPLFASSPFTAGNWTIQEDCVVNIRIEEGVEIVGKATLLTVKQEGDKISSIRVSLERETLNEAVDHAAQYIRAWHLAHSGSEKQALKDLNQWAKSIDGSYCVTRLKHPALAVEIFDSFDEKRPHFLAVSVNWDVPSCAVESACDAGGMVDLRD